ncbi:HAD family hydrolase [Carboxylicivirga sp. N1Y90]|uniref:HAD family hydrolase n=1 Tax=Carboxylicivirga fragile TaxID=3417571 RepID=UPI003D3436D9|nr:HAD family hydrolase [Marinilabiliaceae bacterium N1Y90]
MEGIKVIGFDADDTLWENETFFREAENEFAHLMQAYSEEKDVLKELYKVEMDNMPIYGYGIKAFVLSLLETATIITGGKLSSGQAEQILAIGKTMLHKPVELLDGVEEVLRFLSAKYRLIVATKGDLLDQERKLNKSGLIKYFHHIEVMSDKHPKAYLKLIKHLDILPEQFLMVGNSMKSDVIPVVEIGGFGMHIPFHTTWQHEVVESVHDSVRMVELEKLTDVLSYFKY